MKRRAVLAGLGVAIVVGAMLVGWWLAGTSETETEVGRVSFELTPAFGGEAEAYVPVADWGVRANAFDAPWRLRAELRALDREALIGLAGGDRELLDRVEDQLGDGAREAILEAFAWGLALTAALTLLIARLIPLPLRDLRTLALIVAVVAIGGSGLLLVRASTSFDDRAFAEPTYFARGSELAQLLEFAEREQERGGYATNFERALRSFGAYLGEAPLSDGAATRGITLGSDLHNNALVLEPLGALLGDEPFVFAGDFGHTGSAAEADLIVPRLADLGVRVLAVSGNHDSGLLMNRLSGAGVEVVGTGGKLRGDGSVDPPPVRRLAGMTYAAFDDPLLALEDPADPGRIFSFGELPDGDERYEEAADELERWFASLQPSPDIVAVHQNGLAQKLAARLHEAGREEPLTILTGHDHRQHVDRYGEAITVVDGGSLGAGGIFGVGTESASLARLNFAPDVPELLSVDLISIEPLTGSAQARRVIVDSICEGDEICTAEAERVGPPALR